MKLARNAELVAADMDGDLVMLSIETGAYYGLTGIAPQIWRTLESPHTVDELITNLLQQYEVSEDVLRADVKVFLSEMKENGLIREV